MSQIAHCKELHYNNIIVDEGISLSISRKSSLEKTLPKRKSLFCKDYEMHCLREHVTNTIYTEKLKRII